MRRVCGVLLKAAISLTLVWVFVRNVGWHEAMEAVSAVDVSLWLLAGALFLLSNLLGAVQWRVLLGAQGIRLPVARVVTLYFVGVFFNNFLVSNIGGDAVRVYDLKRLTGRGSPGFAATFLDRFAGLAVLILFAVVSYGLSPELWQTALWVPIAALGGLLLRVLCFGLSRRLSRVVLRLAEGVLPGRAAPVLNDVREGFLRYRRAYRALGLVGALACGVQLSRVAVYWVVGLALGQVVPFGTYVVFIPLIAIVAAVPISFGGIGVRENLGVLLLGGVGVAPAPALATMVLGYLAGIAASLPGGLAFVFRTTPEAVGGAEDTHQEGEGAAS